jgi:NAD(P)-dependent dehydrogenase (short-subunit alcohol dehydrogenase family)
VTPSLAGRVAIVTGGRRGIGRAIALALAEAGADVALGDRVVDDGELEKVAAEVKKSGRRALALQADITKKADVDNLVQ